MYFRSSILGQSIREIVQKTSIHCFEPGGAECVEDRQNPAQNLGRSWDEQVCQAWYGEPGRDPHTGLYVDPGDPGAYVVNGVQKGQVNKMTKVFPNHNS